MSKKLAIHRKKIRKCRKKNRKHNKQANRLMLNLNKNSHKL